MVICYRDSLGLVVVNIDTVNNTGIVFDSMFAYFTGKDGKDYKISVRDIVSIRQEA